MGRKMASLQQVWDGSSGYNTSYTVETAKLHNEDLPSSQTKLSWKK